MDKTFVIEPDKCTGCCVCGMVGSFTKLQKTFSPSQSGIRIILRDLCRSSFE